MTRGLSLSLTIGFLVTSACHPLAPVNPSPPPRSTHPSSPTPLPAEPPQLTPPHTPASTPQVSTPSTPSYRTPEVVSWQANGITLTGVVFNSQHHQLRLLDQPAGPATLYPDAKAAANATHGIAAINAGFFNPDGTPLGLVISQHQRTGAWNTSSLGSGLWIHNPPQSPYLIRRSAIDKNVASAATHALQAGPFLLDHGKTISGLDTQKTAVRSILAWDGNQQWCIARTTACTLAELSSALRSPQSTVPQSFHTILNLDGGRSTDLWISPNLKQAPSYFVPPWNRPVRNFLVITPN